jgi:coproporphyrinogen III oxidase
MSRQIDLVEAFMRGLQARICTAIEQLDGQATFQQDHWQRATGGGGCTRVLCAGAVFEQAGVNF